MYDGAVLSPAVDCNYEITDYTFSKPGVHQICRQLDTLKSNILTVKIIKQRAVQSMS